MYWGSIGFFSSQTRIHGPSFDCRVSSKQSNFFSGSNQNKPKLNLFLLFFGLFHKTKKPFFSLFLCFGPVSKQLKQTELCFETNWKNL